MKETVLAWPAYDRRPFGNPYAGALYRYVARNGWNVIGFSPRDLVTQKYQIFHLHWPDSFVVRKGLLQSLVAFVRLIGGVIYARCKGAKIVWTAHNLLSHDKMYPIIEWGFHCLWPRLVDGIIFLTNYSREEFFKTWGRNFKGGTDVIPHGHYRGIYPKPNVDLIQPKTGPVILFLGRVMRYKGLEQLIAAFKNLNGNVRLEIYGECVDVEYRRKIEELCKSDSRITCLLEPVNSRDLRSILQSTNLAVIPFKQVTNSGSVLLMISHGLPVLVPDLPQFRELQTAIGDEGKLIRFYRELDTAALEEAMQKNGNIRHHSLKALSWARIGRRTVIFYEKVMAS